MSFRGLLPDTITIEPYTGADGYGAPQFGAGVSYRARIEWGPKNVMNAQGQEVVSSARIYVSCKTAFDSRSRVTLPAGRGPVNPPILLVKPATGMRGIHHTVIHV